LQFSALSMGDKVKDISVRQKAAEAYGPLFNSELAKKVRDGVVNQAKQNGIELPNGFIPSDAELESMAENLRQTLGLPNESFQEFQVPSQVSSEQIPLHQDSSHPTQGNSSSTLKWLKLQGPGGDLTRFLASEAFPSSSSQQDGLKLFAKGTAAQLNVSTEKLTSSAALLLPKALIQTWMAGCAEKLPSANFVKALAFLQEALPALHPGADSELLGSLMQKWLGANSSSPADLTHLFGALSEILQQEGLGSMAEAQLLLAALVEESGLGATGAEHETAIQNLSQQLQAVAASGHPLLGGLREFLGNPMQGLSQILQPLLRILASLFLTKPQNQFPNCLPNETALAELAALFGNRSHRPDRQKSRKKRRRKGTAFYLGSNESEGEEAGFEETAYRVRERIAAIA